MTKQFGLFFNYFNKILSWFCYLQIIYVTCSMLLNVWSFFSKKSKANYFFNNRKSTHQMKWIKIPRFPSQNWSVGSTICYFHKKLNIIVIGYKHKNKESSDCPKILDWHTFYWTKATLSFNIRSFTYSTDPRSKILNTPYTIAFLVDCYLAPT
jgi:hypothetical protein